MSIPAGWQIDIGLEIHAQLNTRSKIFSGASTLFGQSPNSQACAIDLGMPGVLPSVNAEVFKKAVEFGLSIGAKINQESRFDRKNYFYPDLPKGYQISQFKHPIVGEGEVQIELADASTHIIGIERLHLEQDAGKSLHDQHPSKSYIDLNRSGVALMEIVSKPEMHSAEQAAAYIKKLRSILRYLGTCDGNMEEGSLRADVNVSVRKPGEPLGTRTETKNLNSVRFIMQTIDYEVQRQIELIEDGGVVVQETRLFDTTTGMTRTMRGKEDAHDYRYFPDPDLLPLKFDDAFIADLKKDMPELPDQIKSRMVQEYGLSSYDANVLTEEKETAAFYELASDGRDRKLTANWMSVELFGALNKAGLELSSSPVSPMQLGDLVDLISDGSISGKIAKEVFADMFETGKNAKQIVEEKGLKQVSDEGSIITMIDDVMASNQDKVDEYRSGKEKLFGFFVGQVMKASQGQANPGMVNQILKEKLKG